MVTEAKNHSLNTHQQSIGLKNYMPPYDRILVMAHGFTKGEREKLSSPAEPSIQDD